MEQFFAYNDLDMLKNVLHVGSIQFPYIMFCNFVPVNVPMCSWFLCLYSSVFWFLVWMIFLCLMS